MPVPDFKNPVVRLLFSFIFQFVLYALTLKSCSPLCLHLLYYGLSSYCTCMQVGLCGYSRISFTKSPASGAGKVGEPSLMSQVGRVHEVVCVWIGVFVQESVEMPVFVCPRSTAVMWLRCEYRKDCETRADGFQRKWRGLCGWCRA
jgi:hypothetical protein